MNVILNVIWTEPAAAALESIQDDIARDNPQAAWDVAQKIRNAVTRLPDSPKLGRTGRVHDTFERMMAGLPYVVPYRIKGHQIQILTVYHSSRRCPNVFPA